MSELTFLERLLDGTEVEWKTLKEVAEYSKSRISFEKLDDANYVGVDNLLPNKEGKSSSSYVPKTGLLTKYCINDILIGNIRPYLRKIWHANQSGGTNGDVLVIHPTDKKINSRYLYHVLAAESFFEYNIQHSKGAKMPRGNKAKIMEYDLPIPKSEVQTEIVRILDTFTSLTTELTTELSARKKQYNYYRDELLSFKNSDVEWKPLGEIGHFIRGKRFTKADYVDEGIDVIHYGEIYTAYGVSTTHARSQVRADMAKSLRYAEPNDVVITDVGETVEDVAKAVAWLGNDKVAIHDHCYAFRHSMNPKFVAYCMQTTQFIADKAKYVVRAKVKTLLVNGFSKVCIPVPPIEEQNN